MNDNKRMAKLLIVSFAFLVWFFASIAISIYSVKHGNTWIFLIALGQFFAVMGIFAIVAMVSEKQNGWWLGAIFVLVGTGCAIYGIMNHFGPEDAYKRMVNAIPLMAGITIMIVGATLLIHGILHRRKLRATCTYEVTGTCVDRRVRGSGYKAVKCPIYEVYYNETRLLLNKNIYTRMLGAPEKDETRKLLVNLDQINKIISSKKSDGDVPEISNYIDEKTDKGVTVFSNILYSSFFIGGIILTIASAIFIPII